MDIPFTPLTYSGSVISLAAFLLAYFNRHAIVKSIPRTLSSMRQNDTLFPAVIAVLAIMIGLLFTLVGIFTQLTAFDLLLPYLVVNAGLFYVMASNCQNPDNMTPQSNERNPWDHCIANDLLENGYTEISSVAAYPDTVSVFRKQHNSLAIEVHETELSGSGQKYWKVHADLSISRHLHMPIWIRMEMRAADIGKYLEDLERSARELFMAHTGEDCRDCKGQGRALNDKPCSSCYGAGTLPNSKMVNPQEEVKEVPVTIEILSIDGAPAPDLPRHLFSGAGTDKALFKIVSGCDVPRSRLSELVENTFVDVYVSSFDSEKNIGELVCIDIDAPALGKHILSNTRQ